MNQQQQQQMKLAKQCSSYMWERDAASQEMGMQIEEVIPGRSVISMEVRASMLNGQKCCHGGYIFALADSAFAFACNSYNDITLAQGCNIEFIRPAFAGDTLTAKAVEVSRGRRTGVYDVSVVRQDAKVVAVFRGKSFALGKPLLESDGLP